MNEPATDLAQPSPGSATLTGQEPFFLVMNTGSGSGDSDTIQDTIATAMAAANRRYELLVVTDGSGPIDTARQALRLAQQQSGIVVAVGGDGTLNAVCQVVLGSGVPFGALPQGTFNYFGRSFGIPQDTALAMRGLLDAVIKPVNVGLVNDRVFLVNASLGLYPQLLEDREAFKQRFGRSRLVALGSALVTLLKAHRQLRVQIESDGETRQLRTPTIVVDNNALQLEHMGLQEPAELARHHLVAITSKPTGRLALYGLLVRGLLSRLGEDEHVISFGFDTMTVRLGPGRRRTKVAMDGEISWLRSPLVFSVAQHQLPLLVPRDPTLLQRA
ncbi:diacylglycerol kinase family protein [Haliea sp. E1-2-M8]|uniref:diacylglycerol/lipid kinase family protein n=1 Tax=Haliea sp. E1-2-M8 TaxID=3064706 RepID=UPI002717BA02|nr:diacylglycerol kinase family protein [Haliea sp. E1-2-M8]MDO8860802.1 diacylglycerol kinase family protein [Haliea sp. E1-2-M8]